MDDGYLDKIKDDGKINFGDEDIESSPTYQPVTDQDIFKFAKKILLWIAIVYLASLAGYIICDIWGKCSDMANNIFDKSTIILPPLAAYVLAYYFKSKGD